LTTTDDGIASARTRADELGLAEARGLIRSVLLAVAKAEFEQSRGPGFVYKALTGDRPPPLDYRNASSVGVADPG
jgi:aminobenzoyl-glutamate utilization protein B